MTFIVSFPNTFKLLNVETQNAHEMFSDLHLRETLMNSCKYNLTYHLT